MTSSDHPKDADERGPDYRPPPPAECDPKVLDDMRCEAKGIAAQAEYNASKLTALDTARTQYEGARKAYSEAREAATPLVEAAGKQLDKLIDQLVCLLNDSSVTGKLDDAYGKVARRLEDCGDQSGCYCRLDCDFDEWRRCPPADVAARIADIEQRTTQAEDCFADLIQEPTRVAERVTAVQAEIKDIETKIAGSPDPATFRRLYAAALVARRHLKAVWRGFADVNEYIDCLCQALTCMLRGHTAIADLKRRLAERKCHKDAEDLACKHLRDNTVEEVLAEYLKIEAGYGDRPPPEQYGDRPPPEQYGDRPPPEQYGDRPPPEQYGDRPPPEQYGDQGDDRGRYRRREDDRGQYGNRPPETETRPQ